MGAAFYLPRSIVSVQMVVLMVLATTRLAAHGESQPVDGGGKKHTTVRPAASPKGSHGGAYETLRTNFGEMHLGAEITVKNGTLTLYLTKVGKHDINPSGLKPALSWQARNGTKMSVPLTRAANAGVYVGKFEWPEGLHRVYFDLECSLGADKHKARLLAQHDD